MQSPGKLRSESPIIHTISEIGLNPKRLVIVDPSLMDFQGHHAQYDLSIAKHALKIGLDVSLISHCSISREISSKVHAVPAFSENMWGGDRIPLSNRKSTKKMGRIFPQLLRTSTIFLLGLIRSILNRPVVELRRHPMTPVRKVLVLILPPVLETKINRIFSFSLELARLILPNIVGILLAGLWKRIFSGRRIGSLSRLFLIPFSDNPLYELEAREGLQTAGISRGDLVFFHMVIGRNLLETALLCEWIHKKTGLAPVVLFRYPPSETAGADPVSISLSFRKFEWLSDQGKVRFASDSRRLIDEYSGVTYVPFELYPIPHGFSSREERGRPSEDSSITFVLPGNARAEKGIEEIYHAIRDLREEDLKTNLAKRIRFLLQVNHPDRGAAPWVERFKRESFPVSITLIDRVLDERNYEELLLSSDVILAPYWKEVYSSRTSGVALEAIVGGKILITTEDTWMSDQVRLWGNGLIIPSRDPLNLRRSIIEVAENFELLKLRAKEASERSSVFHCGQSFVEHLLHRKVSREVFHREILFISSLETFPGEIPSIFNRRSLLAKALTCAGWKVNLVGDSNKANLIPACRHLDLKAEAKFSFDNPLLLLDLARRILSFSRLFGMEKVQYMFRYWWRSRSARLFLNEVMRKCSGVVMESAFLADVVIPLAHAYGMKVALDFPWTFSSVAKKGVLKSWFMDRESDAARRVDFLSCARDVDWKALEVAGTAPALIPEVIDMDSFVLPSTDKALATLQGVTQMSALFRFGLFIGSHMDSDEESLGLLSRLGQDPCLMERSLHFIVVGSQWAGVSERLSQSIIFMGAVSDEVLRALYSLAFFVLRPLGAGSMGTMEAMAFGSAVLGPESAFAGLSVREGKHCLIENDLENFPLRILELLDNPDYRNKIASGAKEFAWSRDYRTAFSSLTETFGQRCENATKV